MAYSLFMACIKLAFAFCLCYAIISDFRSLIIPNWVPLTLVSLFAIFAVVHLDGRTVLAHLTIAAVVFAVAIAFFIASWMGGGDVKLLTAVALWMGPEHAAPFTLLMALLGGMLAVSLLLLRHYGGLLSEPIQQLALFKRLAELAHAGECPYGVAIGVAALLASPAMLWAS